MSTLTESSIDGFSGLGTCDDCGRPLSWNDWTGRSGVCEECDKD